METTNEGSKHGFPRPVILGFLFLLCALIILVRTQSFKMSLERDEGEYAYTAQIALEGTPPYVETYNLKMPGIYFLYAGIMAAFGETEAGIRTGLLLANLAVTILLFVWLRRRCDELVGLGAAVAYAIWTLSDSVLGLSTHATHFLNMFTVLGFLLFDIFLENASLGILFAGGISFGLAFSMKQHAAPIIFFAIMDLLARLNRQGRSGAEIRRNLLIIALGGALPLAAIGIIILHSGAWANFRFWTYDYAKQYVQQTPMALALGNLKQNFGAILRANRFLWIWTGLGFFLLAGDQDFRGQRSFFIGLLFFSFLAVCPGFYFREHYFIPFLPAAAAFSGFALSGFSHLFTRKFSQQQASAQLPLILFLAVSTFLFVERYQDLSSKSGEALSRRTYGLNPFPESPVIGEYLKKHTNPHERIAVIGSEPQIYFYAHRRAATGFTCTYPLMENHPFVEDLQNKLISEVEQKSPKYLVVVNIPTSWLKQPNSYLMIFRWLKDYIAEHYDPEGLVTISGAGTHYYWGNEATTQTPIPGHSIYILRRK